MGNLSGQDSKVVSFLTMVRKVVQQMGKSKRMASRSTTQRELVPAGSQLL
jgi:hypothetical protein